MRLINAKTYALEQFYDVSIPLYAILSHTWETEEVLFKDMENLEHAEEKRGFHKIEFACRQALKDSLDYVWVDTCCIDKSSSAELQEAINSMYLWYSNAECCYVHVSDIPKSCPVLTDTKIGPVSPFQPFHTPSETTLVTEDIDGFRAPNADDGRWYETFVRSKWFTRGWTLQELIAPKFVKFFGAEWNLIGYRRRLAETISKATSIDSDVLNGWRALTSISAARKMAWAAGRKTTRIEDQAYSLLGLFGVNMPMLYGEGKKAFIRLQEEIIRQSSDQSILTWSGSPATEDCRLLAESPADFTNDGRVVQYGWPDSFEMTNRGLRINVPILERTKHGETEHLAVLNCRYEEDLSRVLALRLQSYPHWDGYCVAKVNMRSVAWAEDLGRLTLVDASQMLEAKKGLIEITRIFESNRRGKRCWLNLSIEATITEVQTWGEGMPRSCKRTTTSALVDVYDSSLLGGLGGLLKCHTGELLFVAFSFSKYQAYNDLDRKIERLDVRLKLVSAALKLVSADKLLCDLVKEYSERFAGYNINRREAKVKIGNSMVVHAEVALRNVLGEETIVCTVQQAQEPVEIYTANRMGSFPLSSPPVVGMPASEGESPGQVVDSSARMSSGYYRSSASASYGTPAAPLPPVAAVATAVPPYLYRR